MRNETAASSRSMQHSWLTEARWRRIDKIFELDGHVYAFDSTTVNLCLTVFEWAKFRKHKGGIKRHSLYVMESEVPAFVHITPANIHDSKAMPEIPYDPGAHYVFDRGYNDFSNLYTILIVEAPEDATRYIFLTNNIEASAELISLLYRNRWSVELVFKWIKQHLKITKISSINHSISWRCNKVYVPKNQGMQNYKYLIISHLQNQYFLNDEVRKEIFEIW